MNLVSTKTADVLHEVARERKAQDAKWGEQNHPDLWEETEAQAASARAYATQVADNFRKQNDDPEQTTDFAGILGEEFWEVVAATDDPAALRAELIQVAAVAVAWIEAIDRRKS